MDLVVDANVLSSAAIKDSKTAELLLRDDIELYAPEYIFEEFRKYRSEILERTHREPHEFRRYVRILERRIELCPKESFEGQLPDAKRINPDRKDVPYVALALDRSADIWSDDAELGEQTAVPVLTTTELIEALERTGTGE